MDFTKDKVSKMKPMKIQMMIMLKNNKKNKRNGIIKIRNRNSS